MLWIGRAVSSSPAATVLVPHMPAWGRATLTWGGAAGLWRTRLRLAGWLAVALGLASPAFGRPPDLLLSADPMVGLRRGRHVRPAARRRLAIHPGGMAGAVAGAARPTTGLQAPCPLQGSGGPVALLVRGEVPEPACAASWSCRWSRCGWPATRRCQWWTGSRCGGKGPYALWLDPGGVRLLSDAQARGRRVWMPVNTPRNRLPPGLTPAERE